MGPIYGLSGLTSVSWVSRAMLEEPTDYIHGMRFVGIPSNPEAVNVILFVETKASVRPK